MMRAWLQVAVLLVILCVAGVGTGGSAVAEAQVSEPVQPSQAPSGTPGNSSNATLGVQLAAFMQANAAQTSDSVETGMWVAAFSNASSDRNRSALADRQRRRLESRIESIRADKRALRAAYENGSISRVTYQARLGRLVGRLTGLENALRAAERTGAPGLNRSTIRSMRSEAAALAGGDVARTARGLGGDAGPPAWVDRGSDGAAGSDSPNPPVSPDEPPGQANESTAPGTGAGNGQGGGGSGNGQGKAGH